jgi:hypothetical protein
MADEPVYQLDLEFHFAQGSPLYLQATEGRDRYIADDARVLIERRPYPDTIEETIIHRHLVNYFTITRRKVEPDPQPKPWEQP